MEKLPEEEKQAVQQAIGPLRISSEALAVVNTYGYYLSLDEFGQVWLPLPGIAMLRLRRLADTEYLKGNYVITHEVSLAEESDYAAKYFPRYSWWLQTALDDLHQWEKAFRHYLETQ